MGEEAIRALVAVDPTDIEHVMRREAEARLHVHGLPAFRDVDAAAHHHAGDVGVPAHALDERPLLGGEVQDSAGGAEEARENRQLDGGVLLRRGDEHRPGGHRGQAEEGLVVAIGIKDEQVHVAPPRQGAHQLRAERSVLHHPLALVGERMLLVEDQVGDEGEAPLGARARHGVARDGDPLYPVGARRIVVAPLEVVERARRRDLHLVAAGQPAGEPAAVQLGAAGHLRAVALDHEAEAHASNRSYFSMITGHE